jgi:hypothetical protein
VKHPLIWLPPVLALVLAALLWAIGANVTLFRLVNGISAATGTVPWPFVTILGDTAVAIALLNAYRNPAHEQQLGAALRAADAVVVLQGDGADECRPGVCQPSQEGAAVCQPFVGVEDQVPVRLCGLQGDIAGMREVVLPRRAHHFSAHAPRQFGRAVG